MRKSAHDLIKIFEEEFASVRDKFCVLELNISQVKSSQKDCIWHPGVYVWFHPEDGVLKVGRHFKNARKRALEHLRVNTDGKMKKYAEDEKTTLFLFNVKDPNSYHWVAAVEVYLEKVLKPLIRSKRQG